MISAVSWYASDHNMLEDLEILHMFAFRLNINMCNELSTFADLTLFQTIVKTIHKLSDSGICASCSFIAGSEAEGCAVELESEAHTHLFNMSRSTSGGGELSESVLDCFTVGGAGGYSVHVYEIQCNGELGQRNRELPDVTVEDDKSSGTEDSNGADGGRAIVHFGS